MRQIRLYDSVIHLLSTFVLSTMTMVQSLRVKFEIGLIVALSYLRFDPLLTGALWR